MIRCNSDLLIKNFFDNVYGNVNKIKPRIRWYGELFGLVEHPILEYKIKQIANNESQPLISNLPNTVQRNSQQTLS